MSLLCLALSGCAWFGGGDYSVSGKVKLTTDVDVTQLSSLEVRGYASDWYGEPVAEPTFIETIAPVPADIGLGVDYVMTSPSTDGYVVYVRAWLAHEPGAPGPAHGEPFGKRIAELCDCTTHTAAYADYVNIRLDAVIE